MSSAAANEVKGPIAIMGGRSSRRASGSAGASPSLPRIALGHLEGFTFALSNVLERWTAIGFRGRSAIAW